MNCYRTYVANVSCCHYLHLLLGRFIYLFYSLSLPIPYLSIKKERKEQRKINRLHWNNLWQLFVWSPLLCVLLVKSLLWGKSKVVRFVSVASSHRLLNVPICLSLPKRETQLPRTRWTGAYNSSFRQRFQCQKYMRLSSIYIFERQ